MKKIFIPLILLSFLIVSCNSSEVNFKFVNQQCIDSTLSFRGIFALDQNTAYVSGTKGSLYFTNNGGINWKKINVPGSDSLDFRDVSVIATGKIILMSAGIGKSTKILKTTDNGKSWKVVYQNEYPDGFLDTIEFWNEKNGIAVGDPVNGRFNILLTTDSGNTWHSADSTQIPLANKGEAFFAASGTCISVNGEKTAWISTGGTKARIIKTTDLGKTWKTFNTPILQGKSTTGIFSVHFMNEDFGVITGGNYAKVNKSDSTAAFTDNGGKTWTLVKNAQLPYQSSVNTVELQGVPVFISTGPAGTYYSFNAKKWHIISKTGFHCLSVSSEDNSVWAAGSGGRVAKISH